MLSLGEVFPFSPATSFLVDSNITCMLFMSFAVLRSHENSVAVCGNIVCLILVLVPNLPSVYRAMCTVPVLAITNAMACIVFRKIKFGLVTPDGTR